MATDITQRGITISFSADLTVGQYVTGDYYVVAPSGLQATSYSPAPGVIGNPGYERQGNGAMINPVPAQVQGYDAGGFYDASLNVSLSLPIALEVGDSFLVCTSAGDVPSDDNSSMIDDLIILTVVDSAPAALSFRPPYVGTSKPVYSADSMNYTNIASLTFTAATPTMGSVEGLFVGPWVDHVQGWVGSVFHPNNNMPGAQYGLNFASRVGMAAAMLNTEYTTAQKQNLIYYYVQLGIDLYHIALNGNGWPSDGGHSSGRLFPILFAGELLNNSSMTGVVDGLPTTYFGEHDNCFIVTQTDVDRQHTTDYTGATRPGYSYPLASVDYVTSDIGLPEWGINHRVIPTSDSRDWNTAYRTCCTARAWSGYLMALNVMGMRQYWNHEPSLLYHDRYMDVMNASTYGVSYTTPNLPASADSSRYVNAWCAEMWDAYRWLYDDDRYNPDGDTFVTQSVDVYETFDQPYTEYCKIYDPDAVLTKQNNTQYKDVYASAIDFSKNAVGYYERRFTAVANVSVGFWFRTASLSQWDFGPNVFSFLDASNNEIGKFAYKREGGDAFLRIEGDGGNDDFTCSDNTWYWIAIRYANGGNIVAEIYDESQTLVDTLTTAAYALNCQAVRIGVSSGPTNLAVTVYVDDFVLEENSTDPLLYFSGSAPSSGGGKRAFMRIYNDYIFDLS